MCDMLHKSPKERKRFDEEHSDTPSFRELYEIVLELGAKYTELEKKFNHLNKKKNECTFQHTPKHTFKEWILHIETKINRSHLELIFEHDYLKGIQLILCELIKSTDPLSLLGSDIYIWNNVEWTLISEAEINEIISQIGKKIVKELVSWQKENTHRMANDGFAITFSENVVKAIGGKYTRSYIVTQTQKYIKQILT